jgi:cell division protein FtsI (penicillin-binding protein 3)
MKERFNTTPAPSILPVWRSRLLLVMFIVCFSGLVGRAVYLQTIKTGFLQQKGESRYSRVIEINAHRGMITDRNGEALAISTPVKSIWAIPNDVEMTGEQFRKLASLLEMDKEEIKKRLSGTDRDFIYLKRQVAPPVADKIADLGIPGIYQQREYRRYYPAGEVMSQLVGFTGVDDNGQEGLELAYQDWLAGKAGSRRVIKDRLGRIVEDMQSITPPQEGHDLRLSIDSKIQYLAFRELKAAVERHKAKAGGIVVLDVQTGEVLALANVPTFNPNNRVKLKRDRTRNRVVTDLFEPGSTLKPFTAAAALEEGLFNSESLIATDPNGFSIGTATIHDAHPQRMLTVAQVIQKSSNIGMAKIALKLSPEDMWNMLSQVGFGTVTSSGFPGEIAGKLRPYKTWRPIEQATMAYGHGISVNLLQLAQAYTIFADDGKLKPVSLVKTDANVAGKQIISTKTAKKINDMLEMVVQEGGTAPRAQIAGYRVAGKTGTAHKLEDGRYAENKYVSSFVGFAPASAPRLIIAVMLDEPSDGQYYGGTVAAPVFSSVMAGALRIMSIKPDTSIKNIQPQKNSAPEIREEV